MQNIDGDNAQRFSRSVHAIPRGPFSQDAVVPWANYTVEDRVNWLVAYWTNQLQLVGIYSDATLISHYKLMATEDFGGFMLLLKDTIEVYNLPRN